MTFYSSIITIIHDRRMTNQTKKAVISDSFLLIEGSMRKDRACDRSQSAGLNAFLLSKTDVIATRAFPDSEAVFSS